MKKTSNLSASAKNSTAALVANETKVSKKVTEKADVLTETANALEETESPQKKATFDAVRALFGFSVFDAETNAMNLAQDLATGKITYAEFTKRMSDARKETKSFNADLESLSFADVCEKISNSDLLDDVSLFVKTKDLLSLESRLITGNSVILYHGKQSEDGESFESVKVTLKGLHKPYTDICYTSTADITTSNIIRALRNYGYYLASVKRCKKQRTIETNLVSLLKATKERLHKEFGYMPEDFANI